MKGSLSTAVCQPYNRFSPFLLLRWYQTHVIVEAAAKPPFVPSPYNPTIPYGLITVSISGARKLGYNATPLGIMQNPKVPLIPPTTLKGPHTHLSSMASTIESDRVTSR